MSAFLTALWPNIVSALLFEVSGTAYRYVQRRVRIEKRLRKAFEKAVMKFYADPTNCGMESLKKYADYKEKLLQNFDTEANFEQSVQYKALYVLFEGEVYKDILLCAWLYFQNQKYVKQKLDGIFSNTNEIKQEVSKISLSQQRHEEIMTQILNAVQNSSSVNVNVFLPDLEESVKNLKLSKAHEWLEKIRTELSKGNYVDAELLSKIDYLMGQCSRFQDKTRAVSELNQAYDEMCQAHQFNISIAEGKIIAELLAQKNVSGAACICDEIRKNGASSAWEDVVAFLQTDVYEEVKNLAEDKKNMVVAYLLSLGVRVDLGRMYDLKSYCYIIPEQFTIDTLPLWILYLNISTAKYMTYVGYDFSGMRKAGDIVIELHSVTSKFIEFLAKTELNGLYPDAKYLNFAMAFEIDKNPDHVSEFESCSFNKENQEVYELFHASILSALGRYDESVTALTNCSGEERTVVSDISLCIIASLCGRSEPALEAFKNVANYGYMIEPYAIEGPLICLMNWNEILKPYLPKIQFAVQLDEDLFNGVSDCLTRKDGDVSCLIPLYKERTFKIKALIAKCCQLAGNNEEGIRLLRQDINPTIRSIVNKQYAKLLSYESQYAVEEYNFLKELRSNGNSDPDLLNREYLLAVQCSDYEDAMAVVNKIREILPDSTRAYTSYLNLLAENNDVEAINAELTKIKKTEFHESELGAVIGILERFHYDAEAIDLMYEAVMKYPTVKWKDFYCMHTYVTALGNIVNADVPTIQRDSFVGLMVEGEKEARRVDMVAEGQHYSFLVGSPKAKFTVLIDGKKKNIEVLFIKSKYFKLQNDILKEVSEGVEGYSMKMFKADEMMQSENPLEWLAEKAGMTKEEKATIEENKRSYETGKFSIIPLLKTNDFAAEYYNKMFGRFEIFNHPMSLYAFLLKQSSINFKAQKFVLDISSVMFLYEMNRRQGYKPPFRPVVPKGLRDFFNNNKTLQECNTPSFIEQEAIDRTELKIGLNPFAYRLGEIVAWIDKECDVVVIEKKLMINQELHHDNFFCVEVESIIQAYEPNHFLITEDWGLMNMIQGLRAVSFHFVVTLLDPDNAACVVSFMKDCHFKEVA